MKVFELTVRRHGRFVFYVTTFLIAIFTCSAPAGQVDKGQSLRLKAYMQKSYGIKKAKYAVVVASTMEKLFKDEAFKGKLDRKADICLARNEYEGFQFLLIPIDKGLRKVRVTASDLVGDNGKKISSDNVEISVVGYVETQKPIHAIEPNRVGWWPDPLMPNEPFDVNVGETQPVWITVYATPETSAGNYRGYITINANGAKTVKVPLAVKVWDFALPVSSHMRTAFTFSEWCVEHFHKKEMTEEVRRKWYLFLLQHRLNPMTLYPSNEAYWNYRNMGKSLFGLTFEDGVIPQRKDMEFCIENGMNLFNVSVGYPEMDRREKRSEFAEHLKKHLTAYSQYLEEKGWTDKGILYAFDEIFTHNEEDLRLAIDFLKQLKELAPNLKTAATLRLRDKEVVIDRLAGYLDIWIPLTAHYVDNPKLVEKVKATGAEVWWYVCCVPTDPWPTFAIIESPALDSRIVFWMNWKYGVDAFLYHNVSYWGDNIKNATCDQRWPDIPWVANLGGYNGDGYLTYPGPDMGPLSSIRLENVRDGIEDYDYFAILKDRLKILKKKAGDNEKLKKYGKLLTIDDSIAKHMTVHTKDPDVLQRRRVAVASAIEEITQTLK